jgi:hypothetical protein
MTIKFCHKMFSKIKGCPARLTAFPFQTTFEFQCEPEKTRAAMETSRQQGTVWLGEVVGFTQPLCTHLCPEVQKWVNSLPPPPCYPRAGRTGWGSVVGSPSHWQQCSPGGFTLTISIFCHLSLVSCSQGLSSNTVFNQVFGQKLERGGVIVVLPLH